MGQAETFASGRAFLDALPRQVPACVVLDVQMPGLDGWEVQAELAASGWRVPVIFITAHQGCRRTGTGNEHWRRGLPTQALYRSVFAGGH